MIFQHYTRICSWMLLGWSAFLVLHYGYQHLVDGKTDMYTYHGHDYPFHLPIPGYGEGELDKVLLTIEESDEYQLLGNKSDSQWGEQLISKSWGYVRLGPQDRIFVVTMGHSLHCLRMLNLAFDQHEIVGMGHINHCLRYLQQMMLCAADLTLEPAGWEERDFQEDRIGATHECRDWNKVVTVMDDNYDAWKSKEQSS